MTGLLLKAVSAGRCSQVRTMLETGQDVEQRDECKQTPLIRAIFLEHSRRREKMLRVLLKYDAKTSSSDAVGRNALTWACLYGHSRDVDILLDHSDVDLDLNQADMNGETALFHAASSGSAATVKLVVKALRKYALNLDVANFEGVTPLMQATCLLHDVCAAIIQNGGGTVGVKNMMAMDEELETAEKWAVKSTKPNRPCNKDNKTRVNENKSIQKPPRFPPIISQAVLQKIKFRENRAFQQRVNTPVDSDDDSYYGSEVSYYTDKSFDSIDIRSPSGEPFVFAADATRWGHRSDGVCVMSVSRTSSTENNVFSDEEVSEKIRRRITHEPEDRLYQVTHHLPAFFRVYEELNSPAFRPSVVHGRKDDSDTLRDSTSTDSGRGEVTPTPRNKKGNKVKKYQHKVMELRKMLLRKKVKKEHERTSQRRPAACPAREVVVRSDDKSSDSDTECDTSKPIFSSKSVLPQIFKPSPLATDLNENQAMSKKSTTKAN